MALTRWRGISSRTRVVALPRVVMLGVFAPLALFLTGVGPRPTGPLWALAYDLVLYNAVYLFGAAVCWRVARERAAERTAWRAAAVALLLNAAANAVYTLVIARLDEAPYPSVADLLYLAYYPLLYVTVIGVVRARVPRFHVSMWLDGLIGALGAAGVAIALLLAPALKVTEGNTAEFLTNLAYPVADVLLLALLVGVGAVLGLRLDRALVWLGAGLVCNLVGDILYLDLDAAGSYVEGGPLDVTWLLGVAAMAVAAHLSKPGHVPPPVRGRRRSARVGWRVLAVPLACTVASVALLGAGWGDRLPAVVAWCAVACLLAVLVRTAVTFDEVRRLRDVGRQARTDELTGLPNRRAFLEGAEHALSTATAEEPVALLLLDLDGFKDVNDGLGHHAGDELLRLIGPRLLGRLRSSDLLARLGGDEFAVLLPGTDLDAARDLAAELWQSLTAAFTVEGVRLHVGASIGVATAPTPAPSVSELLRCADVAMYSAKGTREGVRVYVPDEAGGSGDRLRTMEELRNALTSGELLVHVQPQVSLRNGLTVGAEALVRWQHPTRGLLSPADLLPAAEQAGLLLPLADAVLELALAGAAHWWSSASQIPVSVNLSAANVTDLDLPAKVRAALERHGLPPRALTLEIVEDTVMRDPERARLVLAELRALGVAVSIDDYGTGYSSLAYLRHLPADELKLDRTFTLSLATDPRAAAIVEHTVALADALGLRLVAEGVEDPVTADILVRLGGDVAQGFAVAHPMPVEDFLGWLQIRRPPLSAGSRRTSAGAVPVGT